MKPDAPVYLAEWGVLSTYVSDHTKQPFATCQIQTGQKEEACKNFNKARELEDEAVLSLFEYFFFVFCLFPVIIKKIVIIVQLFIHLYFLQILFDGQLRRLRYLRQRIR